MPDHLPLLLLDVDGVLNPFAAPACPPGFRVYRFFQGEDPVRLCERHGEWLAELSRHFDLVWATGWREQANRVIGPVLRLPRLPVVALPPGPYDLDEKMRAVMRYAAARPAAWIDDGLTPEVYEWAAERDAPNLLIDADPLTGLTRPMVDQALRWAADLEWTGRN